MAQPESSMRRAGGCQCGYVRFHVPINPLTYYACHCTDCRTQSASAFGLSYLIAGNQFILVDGSLHTYTKVGSTGRKKVACFCPECGVRIYNAGADKSLPIAVKGGALQGLNDLVPIAHLWVADALPWVSPFLNGPCFAEQPPENELIELWKEQRGY